VRTFGGSRGYVQDLVGTADGTLIAVRGGDRQVSLFDVATGTLLGTPITIPDDQYNTMDLSQDGRCLAMGGGPDGVQVWDLNPDHWATAACQVAGRNLTRDEWGANIGDLTPYHATCPGFPT
jgi:WD40 repeat protein